MVAGKRMSDLEFGFPLALGLLPVTVTACILWLRARTSSTSKRASISRYPSASQSVAAPLLLVAATLFAGLAAAQPRWGSEEAVIERPSGNVVIAFDVSRSMNAEDVTPSRLSVARDAVVEAVDRLAGDRVGLVIFAGNARLRFPLTTDLRAAQSVLKSLETGTYLVGRGTETAQALDLAVETLGGEGIVVLVTDGDDPAASARSAARAVPESGVVLVVAPVGTAQGSTIPVYSRVSDSYSPLTDDDGTAIITRVNAQFLSELVDATGGTLLNDIDSLPTTLARAAADLRRTNSVADASLPIERFQWFAAPAVALMMAAMALGLRPRRRLVPTAGLALIALFGGCATEAYDLNEAALRAQEAGDLNGAITLFYEASAVSPDDPEIVFNLATALHEGGRFDEAVGVVSRLERSSRSSVRARVQSLLGHHWFALGDLNRSLNAFRRALIIDSGDMVARHDYEVVYALLLERGDEQPSPGDDPDAGDGDTVGPDTGSQGQDQPGDGSGVQEPRNLPSGQADLDGQLLELAQEIARLSEEAGPDLSVEEALQILERIEERARLAALRDSLRGANASGY